MHRPGRVHYVYNNLPKFDTHTNIFLSSFESGSHWTWKCACATYKLQLVSKSQIQPGDSDHSYWFSQQCRILWKNEVARARGTHPFPHLHLHRNWSSHKGLYGTQIPICKVLPKMKIHVYTWFWKNARVMSIVAISSKHRHQSTII